MKAIIWYTKVVKEEIEISDDSVIVDDFGYADTTEECTERINGYIKGELDDDFTDEIQGQLCSLSIPSAGYFCEF